MAQELLRQDLAENGSWIHIDGRWSRIYGSFLHQGASIEWHDFRLATELAWSKSFHQHSLEICLNFMGQGLFGVGKTGVELQSSRAALYTCDDSRVPARLSPETSHRFLTLEFSGEYLVHTFSDVLDGLKPGLLAWIDGRSAGLVERVELPPQLLIFREHILRPPVPSSAYWLWLEGKIAEALVA
ncbi:MAG: hypothetical protein ACFCU3_09680 [Verrucomicrobiales bacterium]